MRDEVDEQKRRTLRQFAAVGAATPLVGATSAAAETADAPNETREAIRGYVAATPGVHFSKLRDDLHLGTGETQHHLRRLEQRGDIESHKKADYRRYVPAGRFSDRERRTLEVLRRRTPRRVAIALLCDPTATGAMIADRLDVSRPTVSAAASTLAEAGVLDRTNGYELVRPETTLTLLVRYADSFDDETVALADDAASLVTHDP